jgi:hypothetical protein|tara:strand:- start:177 stop:632 length:456 start_codon:yes stop_codon:yes gene_type:complete
MGRRLYTKTMATKKETKTTLISIKNKYVSSNSLLNEYFSSVTSVGSVILNPIEDEKTESSPERLLFLAVIYQAILDASREELPNESDLIKRQRKEALSWFFNERYVDDLDEICYLAGINSRWLIKIVKQIVDGDVNFNRKRINVLINTISE